MTTPNPAPYMGDASHFEHVLEYLFDPAILAAGYRPIHPTVRNSELIHGEIVGNLEMADLVLCDMSQANANVFFELGIRVPLDRPVALVRDRYSSVIPFDTAMISSHEYDPDLTPWRLDSELASLAEFIQSAGRQERNALWRYFGITMPASPADSNEDPTQQKLDIIIAELASGVLRQDRRVSPNLTVVPDPPGTSEPGEEVAILPAGIVGFRARTACWMVGITYRQIEYWNRTELVQPSIRSTQSGRLYPLKDLLLLVIVKQLLDAGVSLQNIRVALEYIRLKSLDELADVTLMSDGKSVYEASTLEDVSDILRKGRGVFGLSVGNAIRELSEIVSAATSDSGDDSDPDDDGSGDDAA